MGKNLKALLIALAVILTAGAILTSCGAKKDPRFRAVEQFEGGVILVDTETGIGYAQIYGAGSVFPLYDENGEHYRPNGWRDSE